MCRAVRGSYIPRQCTNTTEQEIREDWKEEAVRRGLTQKVADINDDNSIIIQSWTTEGRCLLSKREAINLNKHDIRLSW